MLCDVVIGCDYTHVRYSKLVSRSLGHLPLTDSSVPVSGGGGGVRSSGPPKGWLLVWTGTGSKQETRPALSSAAAAGSATSVIPGGPSFTVMAWPSKGGSGWSGCVFAYPQASGQTIGAAAMVVFYAGFWKCWGLESHWSWLARVTQL